VTPSEAEARLRQEIEDEAPVDAGVVLGERLARRAEVW
jgi:hypothetical protein